MGIQVTAGGGGIKPILHLKDAAGAMLAESASGALGFTASRKGIYALGLRDREYRGSKDMTYRLHFGEIPVLTAHFPLGVERGVSTTIQMQGVFLGALKSVVVKTPADAAVGSRCADPVAREDGIAPGRTDCGSRGISRGDACKRRSRCRSVPGTANGAIEDASATQTWRFDAHKGERAFSKPTPAGLARRSIRPGSARYAGQAGAASRAPLGRRHLRHVARSRLSSVGDTPGSWNDLAVDDYLWAGSELMRIRLCPGVPTTIASSTPPEAGVSASSTPRPRTIALARPCTRWRSIRPARNFRRTASQSWSSISK